MMKLFREAVNDALVTAIESKLDLVATEIISFS